MADETVGRLGAEVFLDDEQVAGASSRVVDNFGKAGDAVEKFAGGTTGAGQAADKARPKTAGYGRGLTNLSFILNDAQRFQVSFQQGIIATSNQIPQLISLLGLSSAVAGPLVVALSALTTGIVLLGNSSSSSSEDVQDLVGSLIDLQGVGGKVGFDEQTLRDAVRLQADLVELREAELKATLPIVRVGTDLTEKQKDNIEAARRRLAQEEAIKESLEAQLAEYNKTEGVRKALIQAGGEDLQLAKEQEKRQREIASKEKDKARDAGRFAAKAQQAATALERQLTAQNRFIDRFAAGLRLKVNERAAEATLLRAIQRLRQDALQNPVPLTFSAPELDLGAGLGDDLFGDVLADLVRLDRAGRFALAPTLELLEERGDTLASALRALSDAGETEGLTILQNQLAAVDAALLGIDVATTFTDPFAEGLANILFGLEKGIDLLDRMKLALRDVVASFIRGGLNRLVGAIGSGLVGGLLSGGNPAAIATGAASGFFGAGSPLGLGGRAGRGGREELVAVVQGGDLAFILKEHGDGSTI